MGEDGRAGRRGRRAGAGARPAARGRDRARRAGGRVPAALSVGAGARRRGDGARPVDPGPGLGRRGATLDVSIVDVAADGYRLRLVDVPAAFDRDAFYDYPDDPWRFAVFCRAALAALRRDGRPARRAPRPRLAHRARRSSSAPEPTPRATRSSRGPAVVLTLHNLAYHGWTGLRLDRPAGPARRASRWPATNPDGIDLLLTAIDRSEIVNTVSPGFAARGADARVRDGPRRRAARQGRPVHRHPQRHRPRRLGPGHRPGARGAVLARGPRGQGGLPRATC